MTTVDTNVLSYHLYLEPYEGDIDFRVILPAYTPLLNFGWVTKELTAQERLISELKFGDWMTTGVDDFENG